MKRRIQAIIYNTLKGFVKTPGFFFLAVFIIAIPWWASTMAGDGTAEGKFKVFITYSFLFASIVLTVANIGIASFAVSFEWKKKTLFLLDVKPVKRWEFIIGKWLGVLSINFIFLLLFFLSLSVFSLVVSRQVGHDFPGQRNIFLTYREISPSATKTSQEKGKEEVIAPELMQESPQTSKETFYVLPKGYRQWVFNNIGYSGNGRLYLLYKFHISKGGKEKQTLGYWLFGSPGEKKRYEMVTRVTPEEVHRLMVPVQAVSPEGKLEVTYMNTDPANVSVLFTKTDFKIRYPRGNFFINLISGCVNLLLLFGFISALGIFFSCLTSSLTAVIGTSILTFNAYMHNFAVILYNSLLGQGQAQQGISFAGQISRIILRISLFLLPPLNKALPHSYIGDFLLLPASYLAMLFFRIIILGAAPLLLIAVFYMSHRELGVPNE
jgi:hypothetical protein